MTSFTRLICILATGLLPHSALAYEGPDSEGHEILVFPMDKNYPVELLQMNPNLPVRILKRNSPWYEKKAGERRRIFQAGQMTEKMENWDGLDRNLFLQRLDSKGARGVASQYPQFSVDQLRAAETELRKVKSEP